MIDIRPPILLCSCLVLVLFDTPRTVCFNGRENKRTLIVYYRYKNAPPLHFTRHGLKHWHLLTSCLHWTCACRQREERRTKPKSQDKNKHDAKRTYERTQITLRLIQKYIKFFINHHWGQHIFINSFDSARRKTRASWNSLNEIEYSLKIHWH